jgi:PAS domain S-box-containing protein
MDVQMPGLDGFETASRIKEMESSRHIPIVFVTAVFRDDPWARKGYAVGGIDYFTKPYDPDLLKLKVSIYGNSKRRVDLIRRQRRLAGNVADAAHHLAETFERPLPGVIITDEHGVPRTMNNEALSIFGCAREPGAEMAAGDGMREGDARFILDQLAGVTAKVGAAHSSCREIVQVRCGDGSTKSLLCSVSLLRDMDSTGGGLAIVVHDVTRVLELEGNLARSIAALGPATI